MSERDYLVARVEKALNPKQQRRLYVAQVRRARGALENRMVDAEQSRRHAMDDAGRRVPKAAKKRGYSDVDYSIAIDGPPKGSRKLP